MQRTTNCRNVLVVLFTIGLWVSPVAAQTYTTLAPPGATSSDATAVSGNNVVGNETISDTNYGFLYNGSTYTTLAAPGATSSDATGVSGNNVVGNETISGTNYGFLYNGSTYTTLTPPGATSSDATGVSGNNVVGNETISGALYGFLYNGSTYTTLAPPGATKTYPTGVSGNNVVGNETISGTNYGFLYNGSTYTTLAPPGATSTFAEAVSGNNVVGSYYASSGALYGFLYNGSTYTTLAPPGATDSQGLGVSGNNVVGYSSLTNNHGFLYNGSTYTTLAPPGATSSYGVGVSGNHVVGYYYTSPGVPYGFLATLSSTVSWTGVTNGCWDTCTANWATSSSTATCFDGSTVTFNNTNSLTGTEISNTNVTISGSVSPQSVTFNNNGPANGGVDYTVGGGPIAGACAIIKNGFGTVTLTGANTYTGSTTINAGVLNAGVAENPGISGPFGAQAANAAGTILFGGGTLQYSAANQFDYSGRFSTAGNQPISIDTNGQTVTFATGIQGAGTSLTLNDSLGTGTLILTASNNYSGGTIVDAGTLIDATDGAIPDGSALSVGAGGTLILDSSAVVSPASESADVVVPEPGTLALLIAGAALLAMYRERR